MNHDDINRNRQRGSNDASVPGNGIHPAVETLSEYLDRPSQLAPAERETIDRHLASCEECQAVLADLRLMVQTLGSLPEMKAPHSFALSAEMLEPATPPEHPAPVVLQESAQWHARHAGKVRWATAVAAVLFVFVISADLVTNGIRGTETVSNDEPASTGQVQMFQEEEVPESDAAQGPAQGAAEDVPTAAVAEDAAESSDEAPASDEAQPTAESDGSTADDSAGGEESEEATTFSLPGDDAESGEPSSDDDAARGMETTEIGEEPASGQAAREDSDQMHWRIAEVSLALILALLLAVMIGLPKQRGRRPR